MRQLLVLGAAVLLVTVLAGCSAVRCAGQSVSKATRTVSCSVSNAWQKLECEACQPPPQTVVTCPVYSPNCCGGDTGIGRGGTGAFRSPQAVE
jgi:predicted small secreted protein